MPHIDQPTYTLDELAAYANQLTAEALALDAHNRTREAQGLPPRAGAIMELTAVVRMIERTEKRVPINAWATDSTPDRPLVRFPTAPGCYRTFK